MLPPPLSSWDLEYRFLASAQSREIAVMARQRSHYRYHQRLAAARIQKLTFELDTSVTSTRLRRQTYLPLLSPSRTGVGSLQHLEQYPIAVIFHQTIAHSQSSMTKATLSRNFSKAPRLGALQFPSLRPSSCHSPSIAPLIPFHLHHHPPIPTPETPKHPQTQPN